MDWLQGLGVPVLLGVGGLFAWALRSRMEEVRSAQERLAGERRMLYAQLLDPYVRIFAAKGDEAVLSAVRNQILSPEYRKTALEVMLIGTDEVVQAYNDLMQYFYKQQAEPPGNPFETLHLYGVLLLAIRKSLGNTSTGLDEWDMLSHTITDLHQTLHQAGIQRKRAAAHPARAGSKKPPPKQP
jgi:hypothetical protein